MEAAVAIAQDERRHARDSWQRTGGSRRRPLRSFITADEKRERRQEHAARIGDALDALDTPEGVAAWQEARELNPDLSPCNQALIAQQAPTPTAWRRFTTPARSTGSAHAGSEDWPRTYVTSDDFDDFVINAVALNHVAGRKVNSPSFDTWRFAGLNAGERAQLSVNLTPTEPGNKELQVSIWGGGENFNGLVPFESHLYGCEDLAIQP